MCRAPKNNTPPSIGSAPPSPLRRAAAIFFQVRIPCPCLYAQRREQTSGRQAAVDSGRREQKNKWHTLTNQRLIYATPPANPPPQTRTQSLQLTATMKVATVCLGASLCLYAVPSRGFLPGRPRIVSSRSTFSSKRTRYAKTCSLSRTAGQLDVTTLPRCSRCPNSSHGLSRIS